MNNNPINGGKSMKMSLLLALALISNVTFAGTLGEDKKPDCKKHKQESRKVDEKSKSSTEDASKKKDAKSV